MVKIATFFTLFSAYIVYSVTVYTVGTKDTVQISDASMQQIAYGKSLFQQYNCVSCHQLYGLGGYLGPELTTTWSDPTKGELFMRTLLKGGGLRMPNFNLSEKEINGLVSYLRYVDSSAISYKKTGQP